MGRVNRKLMSASRSRPLTAEDARRAGNYRWDARKLRRVVPEILSRGMLALRRVMPRLTRGGVAFAFDPASR